LEKNPAINLGNGAEIKYQQDLEKIGRYWQIIYHQKITKKSPKNHQKNQADIQRISQGKRVIQEKLLQQIVKKKKTNFSQGANVQLKKLSGKRKGFFLKTQLSPAA
jgi:hypothetical protein